MRLMWSMCDSYQVAGFYHKVQAANAASQGNSAAALVGDVLLASFDFDVFEAMMREAAAEQHCRK
jgi:hypothetical protein